MNRIFFYLLLNQVYSQSHELLSSSTSSSGNNKVLVVSVLFILFLLSLVGGYKLIRLRTGNYDVEYFTKLLGWVLTIFGIYGIFECYRLF